MPKRNFRVIQGGKMNAPKTVDRRYKFVKGVATTTRLMGVVGLVGTFVTEQGSPLHHVIHLDFEEYGIDGYHEFSDDQEDELKDAIQKVTGGLGGEYVEINQETYGWLLGEAAKVDPTSENWVYDVEPRFGYLVTEVQPNTKDWYERMDLLGPKVLSDESLIHYYLMRLTGFDDPGALYLSKNVVPEAWKNVIKTPGTLLKNTVTALPTPLASRMYRVESLIDYYDRYKLVLSEIEIDDVDGRRQIQNMHISTEMVLTSHEASFQLRKREHIAVYSILAEDEETLDSAFGVVFESENPAMMVNRHGAGDLFTEFNENNAHVDKAVFYLNGDVYANYFVTDEDQLIVSSFDLQTLHDIENWLIENLYMENLVKVGELTADQPILYDFVNSGYGNIYDYLDDSRP